jgi:8-oxo-dGTP pyrophosphatase MutT (NUDIX family)
MKSRAFKKPLWISIGGHFDDIDNGDPDKCIIRELYEESGLVLNELECFRLKYITLRQTEKELRQQYVYMANLKQGCKDIVESDEGILEWIKISDLFNRNMSVTNTALLNHYFKFGINDDFTYGGVATVEGKKPCVRFEKLLQFSTRY